jgi:hypothetical protein
MSSSSAVVSTCSSVAPGLTCPCPAFAFFSSAMNSGETVMCIRLAVDVIGSTTVRGAEATGRATRAWTVAVLTPINSGSTVELTRPPVTTVLAGTTCAGRISATTCFASWRDLSKNFGKASARFSSVITLASSTTLDMQSLPSLRGSTTSGNLSTSRVATSRSNSARARRTSTMDSRSRRRSSAMRRDHSRAFMKPMSHANSAPLQAHGNAFPSIPVRGDLGPRPEPRSPALSEMRPSHAPSLRTSNAAARSTQSGVKTLRVNAPSGRWSAARTGSLPTPESTRTGSTTGTARPRPAAP